MFKWTKILAHICQRHQKAEQTISYYQIHEIHKKTMQEMEYDEHTSK